MSSIADRIDQIIKEKNVNKSKLAQIAGVTNQAVTFWSKRNQISIDAARKICDALNLSLDWLLTGNTTKYNDGVPLSEIENNTVDEWDNNTPLGLDEVAVPFYKSIELAAGHGTTNVEDYNGFKLRFGKTFLRRKGAQKENVICFPVYGDSMEPRIPNKATVAVDTAKKNIIDGDIYAICQDGLCRVKRLYRMPHNKVRINSYNTVDNPDEIDDLANIEIIGRVFYYSADI